MVQNAARTKQTTGKSAKLNSDYAKLTTRLDQIFYIPQSPAKQPAIDVDGNRNNKKHNISDDISARTRTISKVPKLRCRAFLKNFLSKI